MSVYLVIRLIYQGLKILNWDVFGMMLFVIINFFPCIILTSILFLDYTSAELLSVLQGLHLPRVFIIAITITIKYFPTFRQEFRYIKESMRLRGIPFKWTKPLQSFEYFIVPQLFRCLILSDEITAAGFTKGIDSPNKRTSYYDIRVRLGDYLVMGFLLLGAGGIILWLK